MLKARIRSFSVVKAKHGKYGKGAKLCIRFTGRVGIKERWHFMTALKGVNTPYDSGPETPYWSGPDDKIMLNMWFPTAAHAVLAIQRVIYLWDPFVI